MSGEYMKRSRYYVPREESIRYYGRDGARDASNYLYESDYAGEDER